MKQLVIGGTYEVDLSSPGGIIIFVAELIKAEVSPHGNPKYTFSNGVKMVDLGKINMRLLYKG